MSFAHVLIYSRFAFPFQVVFGSFGDTINSSKLVFRHQDVELGTLKLCFSRREHNEDVSVVCETMYDEVENACLDRKAVELIR